MNYNARTRAYIKEVGAVFVESKCKIISIDFEKMQAFIKKHDVYKKRNGKLMNVEFNNGLWVPFHNSEIRYGKKSEKHFENSVYGLEVHQQSRTVKYLDKQTSKRLIETYKERSSGAIKTF